METQWARKLYKGVISKWKPCSIQIGRNLALEKISRSRFWVEMTRFIISTATRSTAEIPRLHVAYYSIGRFYRHSIRHIKGEG